MKKMMKYFAAAVVAIVAVSCVKEMETGAPQEAKKMVDVTFGVNIADEDITKTSLGVENDAPAVLWSEGDKVAVWDGTQINEFNLVSGAGTSRAMFTGQVTEGATEYCVIYPYEIVDSYKAATKDLETYPHTFYITPGVEQSAPVNGFAEKANMAAAYTTDLGGGVTMYNIGGYIKIQIEGAGINSVTVFDNNNEIISGYMAYFPLITDTSKAGKVNGSGDRRSSNHVTLVPENGKAELAEGTYYLVYRASKFAMGMTVKFTHVDGSVAYYSSSAPNSSNGLNTTINLGKVNASTLNWSKTESITIDFSKWPFEEEEPTETGIVGTYTLSDVGKPVTVNVPSGLRTSAGVLFKTEGDYVEFPVMPGKRLKEVHVLSSSGQDLKATVCDKDGNLVGGKQWALYSGEPYTFIIPFSELNTKYCYKVTASTTKVPRLNAVTLVYAGDDVAEISGITASATNSYTGFTVTGEVQGNGLGAATWGIQYGIVEGEWTDGPTGAGGKIEKLVEVPAGTYYVRAWASEDGGVTKNYTTEPVKVIVKDFGGSITLDFINNLDRFVFISTTDEDAGEPTSLEKWRYITGEDVYSYNVNDETYYIKFYSHKASAEDDRTEMIYAISPSNLGLRFNSAGNSAAKYAYMSIPAVPGYKLSKVTYTSTKEGAYSSIMNLPYYDSSATLVNYVQSGPSDGIYTCVLDVSEKNILPDTEYYFVCRRSNYYIIEMVIEYEKVN